MQPENWEKANELFHAALALPADEREDFLVRSCNGDTALLTDVRSLITAIEDDGDFLETPAIARGAEFLVAEPGLVGERIGVYRLISEIGRGGMGAIYLAHRDDDEFQQRVAIKVMRDTVGSVDSLRRFRTERQILAELSHPNIARLLDGGTMPGGRPYFVLEYIAGSNIIEFATRSTLSVNERVLLFIRVCGAVGYAHSRGIIHRDIKPTNVLVTREGEPKLLDFGIARIIEENGRDAARTRTGFHLFTPEYSSPEQARGEPLTEATDIYSLGVLLYELLTAAHPFDFESRSPLEIARIVCEVEPEKPSTAVVSRRETIPEAAATVDPRIFETSRLLRGDLDNIVLKAMRKEPSRRYRTVAELSHDLENFLFNRPVRARPSGIFYRAGKFAKRNPAAAVLSALLVLTTGLFALFAFSPSQSPRIYPASEIAPDAAVRIGSLPATDEFLTFSADGRRVYFVSEKQLFVTDAAGGGSRPVNSPQKTLRIAESPDGQKLVFAMPDGLYLAGRDFSNPRRISECTGGRFSWSPDNRAVAFGCERAGRVNVHVVDLAATTERMLTDSEFCSDPSFAPSGKHLAMACRNGESNRNLDIYTIDSAGGTPVRVTQNAAADRLPAWSPDGLHLTFVSDRTGNDEIFMMAPSGEDVWRVTHSRGSSDEAQWSPDGRSIAFRSNREGPQAVYLLSVENSLLAEKNAGEIEPAFAPDGREIVFAGNRHGQFQIFRRSLDGSNLRQLTWGSGANGFPRFSPDGRNIVFSSNREGPDELYLMNADGTNQVRLTNPGAPSLRPAWSSDGKTIVFVKTVDNNKEIFTLDLFSGRETRLTFNSFNDDFPSFTTTGEIVFFSDRDGSNDVFAMKPDGAEVRNLTQNRANDGQLAVSRDGRVVFTSNRSGTTELWLLNPDGTTKQLTQTAPDGFNSRPQFSPDGESVIYNATENDRDVIRVLRLN